MTERGLTPMDGPVACPFVAFADERDERATSPDHRHRCYAEDPPAPRALAHQEAYCLASAFPVCPTFQDWARREAARARPGAGGATGQSVPGQPIPGLTEERPSGSADDIEPLYEDRPRRNTQRDWAAPPPWAPGKGHPPRARDDDPDGMTAEDAAAQGAAAAAAGAGGGLSGSFADRLVSPSEPGGRQRIPVWRTDDGWDDEIRPNADDGDEPPSAPRRASGAEAAGAAAAAAATGGASRTAGRMPPGPPPSPVADDEAAEVEEAPVARRQRDRSQAPARDREDSQRAAGPSWERPARLEAFPSLRAQRMPSISLPSVLLAAIAVVLAAVVLFFLPGFLGLGSSQPGASPSSSVGATVAPASIGPTIVPEATQQIYLVQSGDTMSKIAKRFGIPLQTLIDANKATLPNPDKLKIGDPVTIPVPAASTVPGTSP